MIAQTVIWAGKGLTVFSILQLSYLLGIPVRGNDPWTVLLCKYYDSSFEPNDPEYFRRWLLDPEHDGSIARYFAEVSNGLYTIEGSNIHGWFKIPFIRQDVRELANRDAYLIKKYDDVSQRMFHKTKQLCTETARRLTTERIYPNVITIINDENIALYCSDNGVLLSPKYLLSSALAHEMVHSFNIGHSFSDRAVKVYPYAKSGEYDDKYDLMSTSNAFMYQTAFGFNGPGLNAPHVDYLGWLPSNRVLLFGKDGLNSATVQLASLSKPHTATKGWLLVLVPYDRNDTLNYYTVEFRTRDFHDQGLQKPDAIIIHKLERKPSGYVFSYLITDDRERYEWLQGEYYTVYFNQNRNYIRIYVDMIDSVLGTADVTITSTFDPLECDLNEYRRNAIPGDHVCVTLNELSEIQNANNDQRNRRNPSTALCEPGYEAREALPGDYTCVTSEERTHALEQNARWQRYRAFFDSPTTGLNGCKPNFVWRQLDAYDFACVSEAHVIKLHDQNFRHLWRSFHNGTACLPGFKMRKAFDGDNICVTPYEAEEARQEAWYSQWNTIYRRFFNGVDSVR